VFNDSVMSLYRKFYIRDRKKSQIKIIQLNLTLYLEKDSVHIEVSNFLRICLIPVYLPRYLLIIKAT
jgi:hypothetical protein